MIRATAAEGQIRAFAVTSKELVEEARKRHNTSPIVTAALGSIAVSKIRSVYIYPGCHIIRLDVTYRSKSSA